MDIKRDIRDKATFVNSGDAYHDLDGNLKQFTHVDHDPKPTFGFSGEGKRAYKEEPKEVLTEEQIYCQAVCESGITNDPGFIADFDKLFKKFGSERFVKGRPVEVTSLMHYGENWYDKLHKLFQKHLRNEIRRIRSFRLQKPPTRKDTEPIS